jgi:hypothetical protein
VIPRIRPFVRQFETHQQLVGRIRPALSRRAPQLDAIIVPASRPATSLATAVTLARDASCDLVVLCSRDAEATEVTKLFATQEFRRGTAVSIPPGYSLPISDFASSRLVQDELPFFCQSPNGDLSVKRNAGLLLGRMLGWQRMFFMDDDIRNISTDDLFATVGMLGDYIAAGMRVTDFPDNSVVCHAHRETGGPQDIFVSGSVLAVDPQQTVGFFPDIYNEDWLFFYEDACSHNLGWSGRNATQLEYDPFAEPGRATRQEFGDVLAEGLYALLHQGAGVPAATLGYWQQFLMARKEFLLDVRHRAWMAAPEVQERMTIAVETALEYLGALDAPMFVRYIRAWQRDLQYWAQVMEAVRPSSSLKAALQRLRLEPASGNSAPVLGRVKVLQMATTKQRPKPLDDRLLRGRHRKGPTDARTVLRSTPNGNSLPLSSANPGPREQEMSRVLSDVYRDPEPGALTSQAQNSELDKLRKHAVPVRQADATGLGLRAELEHSAL